MSEEKDILKSLDSLKSDRNIIAPYKVPDGYFDNLEQRMIDEHSLQDDLLLPRDVAQKTTFQIPGHYFEGLEASITEKLPNRKPAKTRILNWQKWSVAAIVAGLIAFSGVKYLYENKSGSTAENTASVPPIQKLNNVELAEFAEEGDESYTSSATRKSAVDANQLFEGISNQELQNFLNENAAKDSELF